MKSSTFFWILGLLICAMLILVSVVQIRKCAMIYNNYQSYQHDRFIVDHVVEHEEPADQERARGQDYFLSGHIQSNNEAASTYLTSITAFDSDYPIVLAGDTIDIWYKEGMSNGNIIPRTCKEFPLNKFKFRMQVAIITAILSFGLITYLLCTYKKYV